MIARYTQTFLLLQRYDEGLLSEPKGAAGGVLPKVSAARARRSPNSSVISSHAARPPISSGVNASTDW